MDEWSPAYVLTHPQGEALIEELKHWTVRVMTKEEANELTKTQESE